jgi:ubiquinone biosynthesis monooxygenase Coq7
MVLGLRTRIGTRSLSTHVKPSSAYLAANDGKNGPTTTSPKALSRSQREILDSAIRVDQAGEIAANWIYAGQMAVLGRHREVGPLIQVFL